MKNQIQFPISEIIKTSKGPIELARSGKGAALLSLHGGMGGCDQSYLLARAALANMDTYDCLSIARPGYWGSQLAEDKTPAQQADRFCALLDSLKIEKAHILAISAAGPSAVSFAARHPDRCTSLVLISCCTGYLPTEKSIYRKLALFRMIARFRFLTARMKKAAEKNPDKTAQRSIPDDALRHKTLIHPDAGPLMMALQTGIFERTTERLPGTLNDTRNFAQEFHLPFAKVSCPTLLIHGTDDRIVPYQQSAKAHQDIEHSQLVTLEGADHVALFTHIEQVRAETAKFLSLE